MADQDFGRSETITQLLRHVTSSPHNGDVKGDIFRHTIYPPNVVVIIDSFYILGVTEGGCGILLNRGSSTCQLISPVILDYIEFYHITRALIGWVAIF